MSAAEMETFRTVEMNKAGSPRERLKYAEVETMQLHFEWHSVVGCCCLRETRP